MKRYFKRSADSDFGVGTAYVEFDGDWVTRQVEVYGDRWFWASSEERSSADAGLSDQAFSEDDLGSEDEIEETEFEAAWNEARRRCR